MENLENNVAIYLDFENLVVSAEQAYPSYDMPLQMQPILDYCATKGNISIKKAYADWSKGSFNKYQAMLLEQGFELVYLPETSAQGKNGSDVKLAVDAMENLELFKSINKIVIGSGDTDFIPLIQKIRSRSLEVIVLGFEHSVGKLVKKNSVEFRSLEEIIGLEDDEEDTSAQESNSKDRSQYGRDIMLRYIRSRNTDEPVHLGQLKQGLLKIESSFSEKKAGCSSFKKYLEKMKGDLIEKITNTGPNGTPEVHFKDIGEVKTVRTDATQELNKYLVNNLKFIKEMRTREKIITPIIEALQDSGQLTMNQMNDLLVKRLGLLNQINAKRFLTILFTGHVLVPADRKQQGPLMKRGFKLKNSIRSWEDVDRGYRMEIRNRLKDLFPNMGKYIHDNV